MLLYASYLQIFGARADCERLAMSLSLGMLQATCPLAARPEALERDLRVLQCT